MHTVYRYLLLWISCAAGLTGCMTESAIDPPGEVLTTASFSFEVPGMVNSRAVTDTHECTVENVWILLFDTSEYYVGKYKGSTPVDDGGDITRKKFEVELPSGTFYLFAVVNCESQLNGLTLTEGMPRTQVEKALLFRMEQEWGYIPEIFTPFPMWGMLENIEIGGATPVRDLPVIRAVVRIDKKLDPSVVSAEGKVTSVYLYNRYTAGQVIPNAGTVFMDEFSFSVMVPSLPQNENKIQSPLVYMFDPATEEITYTIYTFEAPAGSAYNLLDNTCLVLGIGDKDEGGGGAVRAGETYPNLPVWFYRVDFVNDMKEYLPLLRNNHYVVTVDKIINRGFPEPWQAFRSEPYGIEYTVVPWEEHENDLDVGGGIYRLDVSETLLEISALEAYTQIQVSTTHPDGWSAYISAYPDKIDPTGINWMMDFWAAELDHSNYYFSVIDMPAEKTLILGIETFPPAPAGIYHAYIHIVAGNLTNVVTIKKKAEIRSNY